MIEDIQSSNRAYFDRLKSRDYKCPCGKSYLSYAALFTHIKQKHQGKPPGKISKPGGTHQKRGRPSLKSKTLSNSQNINNKIYQKNSSNFHGNLQNSIQKDFNANNSQNIHKTVSIKTILQQLNDIMEDVPSQSGRRIHLNEMQAFTEMLVIFKRQSDKKIESNQPTLVNCLIGYLSLVSQNLKWGKFEQLYILLVLYLQFIIDEENNKNIIKTASVDILCEYINDFIQNHLQALAEYYELQNMQIIREHIAIGVFSNLFKWLMLNGYTKYVIQTNSEINKRQMYQEKRQMYQEKCQIYQELQDKAHNNSIQ